MEPDSREITPPGPLPGSLPGPGPDHHHPVPSSLVRLYGLFAVLLVLLPEWMADLRQMSRNVRVQARGELDQDRLSLTLRRRLAARRRRELKAKASPDHPPVALAAAVSAAGPAASPIPSPQRQPQRQGVGRGWQAMAQAALLVGVGAALVWGANQIKLATSSRGAFSPRPGAVAGGGAGAAFSPVPAGQLRLESPQPSWVEVRTLEGRTLYAAILKGRVQLPLGGGLKVLAGRPDLVRASRGAELPQPLGTIDRITWVVFDASAPVAGQNPAP